jgi:hypothetical protein
VQVPDVDELKAKNLFETSKQLGQAIVTTALKEHAGPRTYTLASSRANSCLIMLLVPAVATHAAAVIALQSFIAARSSGKVFAVP